MRTVPGFSLAGTHISLRPLTEADASLEYARWLNDPTVNAYLETRACTQEDLKRFIREKNGSEEALLLGIFWRENDQHIGNVKLEPIDRKEGAATLGILIGNQEYWGRGVATEATRIVTDYAFRELGLRTIILGVIAGHARAIRVYEKCGFVFDHIEKDAVNHDGALFDRIVMRLSAPNLVPSAS